MCDDCSDMCVHEGKLANCRLDECRKFGTSEANVISEEAKEMLTRQQSQQPVNEEESIV